MFINILLCLLTIWLSACQFTERQFNQTQSHDKPSQLAPNNDSSISQNRNERPSEDGIGIPGYKLECKINRLEDFQASVGCSATNDSGRKLNQLDLKEISVEVPANQRNLVSTDLLMTDSDPEISFYVEFSASVQGVLVDALLSAVISVTTNDEENRSILVSSGIALDANSIPESPAVTDTCETGFADQGLCFYLTTRSCTDYCAAKQQNSAEVLKDLFASPQAQLLCQQALSSLLDRVLISVVVSESFSNLGCYETAGIGFLGTNQFDPNQTPTAGTRRICACN